MHLLGPVENDNAPWSDEMLALYRRYARQRQRSLVRRLGMRRPLSPSAVACESVCATSLATRDRA